jgi:RNA polymerase sigma-70 factor (ECF subfamily)
MITSLLPRDETSGGRAVPGVAWVPEPPMPADRLHEVAASSFRGVWRALRRFGVWPEALDDATQQVFATAAAKLHQIEPGKERAYLLGVAYKVASNVRRARKRHAELGAVDTDGATHPDPNPEELLELKRHRILLDEALDALPREQRAVFVLYELEGCSLSEISEALELPMGTVASRLRRARSRFETKARELSDRELGVGT